MGRLKILIFERDNLISSLFDNHHNENEIVSCLLDNKKQLYVKIKSEKPDIIFLNINLTFRSNLEILQLVTDNFTKIPVVVISDQINMEAAVMALKSGAYDILTKPLTKEKIFETLQRVLHDKNFLSGRKKHLNSESSN